MDPAVEQFEVVSQDEQRTDCDEREQPEADGGHADDAQRAREKQTAGGEPDEPRGRNVGVQRSAVEFVECMGRDADGEEEREQRRKQAPNVDMRRQGRTDDDIRQVPRRVRGMEQRPPIAPAASACGVERGP